MTNIGQHLRNERESRGLTLTYISEVTKISRNTLVALEENDLDALPAPTFVKGFIRAYSGCIGCDDKEAVLCYEQYLEESRNDTIHEGEQPGTAPDNKQLRSKMIIPAGLIVITLLFFIIYPWGKESPDKDLRPKRANTISGKQDISGTNSGAKKLKNTIYPVTPVPKENKQQSVVKKKVVLAVTAREITWMKIVVDDEDPFEVLLKKGETVTWKAKKGFSLVIGNARGIDALFNGKTLKPLGKEGEVVHIKLYTPLPKNMIVPHKTPVTSSGYNSL